MSTLPNRRIKLTYQHYLLFREDGRRDEIIEGEHYMSPAPETAHQQVVGRIFRILANHLVETGQGTVLLAPTDVILSEINVVQPDLVYVSKERTRIIGEKNIRGTPDLLIEVLSPGTLAQDRTLKRYLYARFGVAEYWIADPKKKTIEVFRLGKSGYARPRRFTRKDTLSTPLVPGLRLDLKEIFR